MGRLVSWARGLALTFGAPGLAIVAALDSSFLPLPGVTDFLLIVLVTRHPHVMVWAAAAATLGSVAGCLIMYLIGRKGGEVLVSRRFTGNRIERATAALKRHGVIAVLIPSLLPPPAPFKIFVLLAGVIGIPVTRFALAIALGRGARYLALGALTVRYGARAQTFLAERGVVVSLVTVGVLIVGFVLYLQVTKARGRKSR